MADNYVHYRKFWGGNPSEVFSHWLDMVLMSGSVAVMSWLLIWEAFFKQREKESALLHRVSHICLTLFLVGSGAAGMALDGMHGEGTVAIAYPIFFVPILVSTWYLLRRLAALLDWRLAGVAVVSVGVVALHTAAQLFYEPSQTGGPNGLVGLVWLGSVGAAVLWVFVRSIRTGSLARCCLRFVRTARRPMVWGSTVMIVCAIGIPITVYAKNTRKIRQDMAFQWLDELDLRLTDEFVAEIKRDPQLAGATSHSQIPVSPAVHALFADARIKGDNALRIFVPLNQDDYIFLWGNDRFEYCDVRRLARGQTEQMNQDFIDALMAKGGTHQTGLYSVLWSPYMAGRVLKDKAGNVKAVCVINAP